MFTVYVLYSQSFDKIYIGYTSDLEKRLLFHNELGRTSFTSKYRPWVIVYSEEYAIRSEAIDREKQLKGGQGRHWIRNELIPNLKSGS